MTCANSPQISLSPCWGISYCPSPGKSNEQSPATKAAQLLIVSFPHADEVNLLDKMTSHAQDLTNTSFGYDEANCSVLGIGQYSTLSIPTREAFGDRWASGRAAGLGAAWNHPMHACGFEGWL